MKYVVNIETSRGEGLIFIEDFEDEILPLYERVYIPFVGEDEWVLDLLGKSKTINEFRDWFYQRGNSRIVSVMLAKCFEEAHKFIDLSEEKAFDFAIQEGCTCRVVMRDGVGEMIGPGFDPKRINLWIAKGHIYRAEYF